MRDWKKMVIVAALVGGGTLSVLSGPASAQSLTNGYFSSGLSGWSYDTPIGSGAPGYAFATPSLTVENLFASTGSPTTAGVTAPSGGNFAYVVTDLDSSPTANRLWQTFDLAIGEKVSLKTAFATEDYASSGFDDFGYVKLFAAANPSTVLLSWTRSVSGFALDGDSLMTSFSTGWQSLTSAAASVAGSYTLEFGVQNVGSSGAPNSYVMAANVQVSATPGPIAGAGLPLLLAAVGFGAFRLRRSSGAVRG